MKGGIRSIIGLAMATASTMHLSMDAPRARQSDGYMHKSSYRFGSRGVNMRAHAVKMSAKRERVRKVARKSRAVNRRRS